MKHSYKKYAFRKYNKKYPELFRREKSKLKKFLLKNTEIEHIGSTAVPGLGGKGVLDVMVVANRKNISRVKKQLEKIGYIFKESGGEKDRLFFKKTYKYSGKMRMVHIQLTSPNTHIYKRMIKFRDKLIKDKEYAKKYENIKKEAVRLAKGEGKIYRGHKEGIFEK